MKINTLLLEKLYIQLNDKKHVHPDPLEFLYLYEADRDREVVGLIAALLAYGRVEQILKSVSGVLETMNPSPYEFICRGSFEKFQEEFKAFQHRFTTGDQLAALLEGVRLVLKKQGSLELCFKKHLKGMHDNVLPALTAFVAELAEGMPIRRSILLPWPEKGSACKRLHLFLRWMVRQDAVDPGVWSGIPMKKLLVPLDTHMHRMALDLEATKRKQADLRTALEVTEAFKKLAPDDPVKYDFALTRLGISIQGGFKEIFPMLCVPPDNEDTVVNLSQMLLKIA